LLLLRTCWGIVWGTGRTWWEHGTNSKIQEIWSPPPPPSRPPHTPPKGPVQKKGLLDWPANIISNAFNSKHLDVFSCWKKKIFMSNIAPLVFPMCLFNTPITTCYFVVLLPCLLFFFFFFPSFFVMLGVIWMCFSYWLSLGHS